MSINDDYVLENGIYRHRPKTPEFIIFIDETYFFKKSGFIQSAGGPDSDTPESELTKAARSTWARLIKKVYEVQVLADVLKVRDSGILQVRVRGRTR